MVKNAFGLGAIQFTKRDLIRLLMSAVAEVGVCCLPRSIKKESQCEGRAVPFLEIFHTASSASLVQVGFSVQSEASSEQPIH